VQRFEGKVAVIVGAAAGIGAATARRLAAEGAQVVVADIDLDGAERTAAGIVESGGAAAGLYGDLADEASLQALMDTTVDRYGGIDVLHCNGADLRPEIIGNDTNIVDIDLGIWDRTLQVNLRGYVLATRHAIPLLLQRGGGAIVMTSSGAAFAGEPERPAYAAAKSAINALVRHIASRWGRKGIRANAIAPGFVLTEAAKQNVPQEFLDMLLKAVRHTRLGTPEDIAAAVAYLASQDGEWVNGQVLGVDGGTILR
jgi:NAD(P)-dependent dehydrogenase (short-subunit alcohol dehydrogenase family)